MLRRCWLKQLSALAALGVLPAGVWAAAGENADRSSEADFVYDVVVIGTGLAGLCAAVSAKEAGAGRVLMIEKAPLVGGHSAIASGSIAFVDPKRQAEQGIVDSVEKFVDDAWTVGGSIDEELVRYIGEKSGEGITWLERQGVRFWTGAGWHLRGGCPPSLLSLIHI